jgi:hypothetical protein
VPWKVAAGHDENGAVDEQREHQRGARIDRGKPDCLALARVRIGVLACLHDGRMQVQVVRHHRRAENADGDVQHVVVAEYFSGGNESGGHCHRVRMRQPQFDRETRRDHQNECHHQRFDVAKSAVLQEQHD